MLWAPRDAFEKRAVPDAKLDAKAWQSIAALLLLFAPVSLFWATYEQQGNTITLWADQFTDRHFLGSEIPVTWFQAFNPFVTKIAPTTLLSMMMGVWLATSFVGGFLAGYLGTFWSTMDKANFFLMLALISTAAGVAIMLLHRPLRSVLQG